MMGIPGNTTADVHFLALPDWFACFVVIAGSVTLLLAGFALGWLTSWCNQTDRTNRTNPGGES